ncbi:hypothetical protein Cus16_2972 [Curtobacterium sp. ER1/6]|nr:hypothetical protein Cus16_2972 [Curtobacterium sp. ER1/6]
MGHHDRVAGGNRSGPQDAQVRARTVLLGEPADPPVDAHPPREGPARHPRDRDLELEGLADPPPFAGDRPGDVDAARPQVLAEESGRDVAVEHLGEVRGVLVGVGVHGLVLAAVVLPIGLHVGVQAERAHPDGAVDGSLVDRGDADGAGVAEELLDAADGGDEGHDSTLPHAGPRSRPACRVTIRPVRPSHRRPDFPEA